MSEQQSSKHYGKVVRKLTVIMLALVFFAVLINSIMTVLNTGANLVLGEEKRLTQIGEYSATAEQSITSSSSMEFLEYWDEYADDLSSLSGMTYEKAREQAEAVSNEYEVIYQRYEEELGRREAGETVPDAVTTQDLQDISDKFLRAQSVQYYFASEDLYSRLKSIFDIEEFAVFVPNEQNHTVRYIFDVQSDHKASTLDYVGMLEGNSSDDGHRDQHYGYGEVAERPVDDYPDLWRAYQSGQPSYDDETTIISMSPDDMMILAYVPFTVGDNTFIIELGSSVNKVAENLIAQVTATMLISVGVLMLCMIGVILLLNKSVVNPIRRLSAAMQDYAGTKSPEVADKIRARKWPRDEIGRLADNAATMVDEIDEYVNNIEQLSYERERTRSELEVASRIQVSALPQITGPFAEGGPFELWASMYPAKAVGGDFYDFFEIDENHIGIVMADVSDKGVPAALFMMRARGIIRKFMMDGLPPAEAMAQANDDLCTNNDNGMFVTVWLGVLDIRTGELRYANGGHNPPVHRHTDGSLEWIAKRSGLILGSFEGMPYRQFELHMQAGDVLFLYTDGVTEAMDIEGHCYGEEKLMATLAQVEDPSPEAIINLVGASVNAYAEGADQADDFTMLALRYNGNE